MLEVAGIQRYNSKVPHLGKSKTEKKTIIEMKTGVSTELQILFD